MFRALTSVRSATRAVSSLPRFGVVRAFSSASPDIVITESCAMRLRELTEEGGATRLRVAVDAGGCSGFQYSFELDDKELNDDDRVFSRDEVEVVVDLSLIHISEPTRPY
eukprot:TRINITY_DN1650_c0_g1_i2.p1 TRINITY_DN1650_c0_g1~~TRINITY_DN1650_c0_g1_i2.p1  ORF type:complete len:110 (-),score=16.58 TRINITY_DN1650_c0_g1_i2:48-377(-)